MRIVDIGAKHDPEDRSLQLPEMDSGMLDPKYVGPRLNVEVITAVEPSIHVAIARYSALSGVRAWTEAVIWTWSAMTVTPSLKTSPRWQSTGVVYNRFFLNISLCKVFIKLKLT